MSEMKMAGFYSVDHFDVDGNLKATYELPNGIVDVGMNHILDTQFHGSAAVSPWYISLVDNAAWSAFANADTMAAHAGWAESVAYTEANRVEWTEGAAATRSITNAATVDFSINATVTFKGIFVTSDNTKSGTIGTLWSTAAFASTVSAVSGDTLKITYTVSG